MNIGIYIYDNAEVLDFSGPFEVFSTASRLAESSDAFEVFFIAEQKAPVVARGGFSVNPHYDLNHHPEIDLLIVVGGVHSGELQKTRVINWLASMAEDAKVIASICTGAFILAEAGLLAGRKVTTHWEDIDELRKNYPDLTVIDGERWIDEGNLITSGGISAGIDMSLHLVSRFLGPELAEKTARQMEYDWIRK